MRISCTSPPYVRRRRRRRRNDGDDDGDDGEDEADDVDDDFTYYAYDDTTAIAAARSGTAPAATGKGKNFVQGLVSKKKLRFVKDGFDLDLSYITPQLIAMGWPSTGTEAIYRNPANEVRKFLDLYHPSRAKVYNLCVEKHYDAALLGLAPERLEQHAAYDRSSTFWSRPIRRYERRRQRRSRGSRQNGARRSLPSQKRARLCL